MRPTEPTHEPETVSVLMDLQELWLLQAVIRHDLPQRDQWSFPPASVDLNDQIAAAILTCVEVPVSEAPLLLSRGDLLAIDYCVGASMKDASGVPIGKQILLKSFAARRALRDGEVPESAEPAKQPTATDVRAALAATREPDEYSDYSQYD